MAAQLAYAPAQVASAKAANPLCFLMDDEFAVRQELANELRRHDIDVVEFSNSARFVDMVDEQRPDIIFIHLQRNAPRECVRGLMALKECAFSGVVQLFGHGEAKFLENFNTLGVDCALTMLPPLAKPIEFAAIRRIIQQQKLATAGAPSAAGISLDVALVRNLITFLYQPKLELKTNVMVGAEVSARIAPPGGALLGADQFLKGAHEDTLLKLSRFALVEALKSSAQFLEAGVALRLSINIGASNLLALPIADLVKMHRPEREGWPGLILEVPARQVFNKIDLLKARATSLQQCGVSIAIDNFGLGTFNFNGLRDFPFGEIKIDRTLVDGCADNAGNASIAKSIIQMAHNFDGKAVAVGISRQEDLQRITELGCDMGQGFLLGKPISRAQMNSLIATFKERSG
jgi:EAL domain-containing protein (putative c-di-GMP-specific phosphodiesterase class I)